MILAWLFWAAVALGIIVASVLVLEWLYRRRHPYVVGLRPLSARRYARYGWGRIERFPAVAARNAAPYWPWFPLLLRRPLLVRFAILQVLSLSSMLSPSSLRPLFHS